MEISAVVITHNRIDLLYETIASIDKQTLHPREIIIVDDGSEFSVEKKFTQIGRELTDIEIKFVRLEDLGPSAARNAGAETALGNIVAFMDDDDLWEETYLKEAVNTIKNLKCDAVITWMDDYLDGNIVEGKHLPKDFFKRDLYSANLGITGSNIVVDRVSFLSIGGFDAELLASEDKDLLIRMVNGGVKIAVNDKSRAYHRVYSGTQLSHVLSYNTFKVSGKTRFLKKYEGEMSAKAYRYLKAQLGFIHATGSPKLTTRFKGLMAVIGNKPGMLKKLLSQKMKSVMIR